ncbi:MAG: hypothetical protein BroJett012_06830 [Betaproteobacteria bacterium]|jgi:hypothetical protein|nr:MAG: hypothetical protein BroJett012_06830 [Betaproteobacteria bacterium]
MRQFLPALFLLMAAIPVYALGYVVRAEDWAEGFRLVLAASAFGLGSSIMLAAYRLPDYLATKPGRGR